MFKSRIPVAYERMMPHIDAAYKLVISSMNEECIYERGMCLVKKSCLV